MCEQVNINVQETNETINIVSSEIQEVIDINVFETTEDVTLNITEEIIQVNINKVTGGGEQTLAETLVFGNNTGGTDILLNNDDKIQLENNSSLRKGTYDFGQNGGVSRICGVDYEDMWQGGIRHVFDTNGLIRNSTNGFNIVPDSSFDVTLRFKIGSIWTLDDGTNYICTDATEAAAVWELYNVIPTSTSDLTNDGEDGVNPFITAADIPTTPNLQQVTDAGNETGNQIKSFGGAGESIIDGEKVYTTDFGLESHAYLHSGGYLGLKSPDASYESYLSNNLVQNIGVVLEFPNKSSGNYTIATTNDIPPVTGFVPYTGATQDVNLGTHDLTATQGTFATSGNPDTLTVNHTSGSGKALTITKGGAGEGIYVNKTSGSGNAVTIVGDLEATNLKRTGGTSSQFLKANGSIDSTTYQPTLVSGTNIKTINGASVLGSGDLVVGGSNIYNANGTLTSNRTVTSGGFPLTFTGSNTAASAVARGLNLTHTLVAAANSDVLVGLDIQPTFTNGAFTGLTNVGLRLEQGTQAGNNTSNIIFKRTNVSNFATIGYQGAGWNIFGIWGEGTFTATNAPDIGVLAGIGVAYIKNNLLINTTTNAGFRLDVNGTARVSGALTFANASTGISDLYIGISDVSPFSGNRNIIIGNTSGTLFSTGTRNVILGMATITNTSGNTVQIGNGTTTTGSNSISIGTTTSCAANSIAIGLFSRVTGANSINISTGLFSVTRMAIANDICFAIGSSYRAETTANNQGIINAQNVFIGRPAKATSTLSDSGNGVATSINGMGGYALTDATGGDLTIAGGIGLGTGTSGDLIFSTATPTTTGTTLQTLTQRWFIKGSSGILANVSTPNASAQLQVDSTTKGFLPPRMTNAQRLAIASPAIGLIVYCTDATEGLYINKSTGWTFVI